MHAVTLLTLMMTCGPKSATETTRASDTAPTTDSSALGSGDAATQQVELFLSER